MSFPLTDLADKAKKNAHSLVVHSLGLDIVSGHFAVGSILPGDLELADKFGVSRTVLREAMKTLAAKGMVFARARVGTRVTERTQWNLFDADVLGWHVQAGIDAQLLQHLSDMRLTFEPAAAALAAADCTPDNLDRLYTFARAMGAAPEVESFALADVDFHKALLVASNNPFMAALGNLVDAALFTIFRLTTPADTMSHRESSMQAHLAIVDAIANGQADAAAAATVAVINQGRPTGR